MLVHRILRAAVVALTLCAAAAVALLVTLPADSGGHTATLADLPAAIGGSVVTEQGEPLAGVTVTVVALAGGAAVTTTTDLDGSYRFTVTAAGDYVVAPSLPGRYFTPPDRTLVIPPDYLAADFIGAASPATLSISGRTQTDAGAPIVGATVWAHAATGEVFTATSAANGAFVVGNVITGAYVLRATAQTHYFAVETSELAVPPSQADILLVGEPYATIRGVVRDGSAAPIAAITVTAELTPAGPLSATLTDVQGAYTLTQLTAGLYRITPVHANYRFTPVWRELMTPPDADAVDFVGEPHFVFYLPLVQRPPPDLTVRHIEVTQATQTGANSVPLVAGRPTLARVYAMTDDALAAPGIFLELTATRNGQSIGAVRQGPGAVWSHPARDQYETTFNVRLPAEWLAQEIEIRARIDPDNAFKEADESNNHHTIGVAFRAMPPLQVKYVPINYTHRPTGAYFPSRWDLQELDFLKRVFPVSQVDISVRAPLNFSGDLSSPGDWSALLSQIADLKIGDGAAPEQVYYGFIPLGPADGVSVSYGGLGFVGYRAAIGLVNTPATTAHEIGHNLGLLHAPCGSPAYVDQDYPYANAQIGEYGVDVLENRLLGATVYRDLMSYCGPRWISDYNYDKAFQDQQANGRSQLRAFAAGQWIRVHFDARGAAQLLPTYSLNAPLTAPAVDSPYAVELLDAQGEVIAEHPLALLAADERALFLRMMSAIVPQPAQPVAALRVTANGALLTMRTQDTAVPDTATSMVAQRATASTLTWQGADRPALVRYSADSGQTWTTLGIDLQGGAVDLPADLQDATLLWEVVAGQ